MKVASRLAFLVVVAGLAIAQTDAGYNMATELDLIESPSAFCDSIKVVNQQRPPSNAKYDATASYFIDRSFDSFRQFKLASLDILGDRYQWISPFRAIADQQFQRDFIGLNEKNWMYRLDFRGASAERTDVCITSYRKS
jgi:hypothetical protein